MMRPPTHDDAIIETMRTTVQLEADVAAAVDLLRRQEGLGLSEAVNALIRRGLAQSTARRKFKPRSYAMGIQIPVDNVAEALELLEGPTRR